MLPLIKGYGSEKVYELLAVSLQCFGGSGYCQDYPIEQYIRDQKIDSLYEGTTHIQALDLFFRKIGRDRGATLQALVGQIAATIDGLPAELAVEKAALQTAVGDVQGDHGRDDGQARPVRLSRRLPGQPDPVRARRARDRLAARRQRAGRARRSSASATGDDAAFYKGKLAAARFYAKHVLPGIGARAQAGRAGRPRPDGAAGRQLVMWATRFYGMEVPPDVEAAATRS